MGALTRFGRRQGLPGTDGAITPSGPDNEHLGFFAQGKLKKMPWRAAQGRRCATPSPAAAEPGTVMGDRFSLGPWAPCIGFRRPGAFRSLRRE